MSAKANWGIFTFCTPGANGSMSKQKILPATASQSEVKIEQLTLLLMLPSAASLLLPAALSKLLLLEVLSFMLLLKLLLLKLLLKLLLLLRIFNLDGRCCQDDKGQKSLTEVIGKGH